MTTAETLSEVRFREWLRDVFAYDNDCRADFKKYNDRVYEYMRGVKPKKHKEVKMSRKEMSQQIGEMKERINVVETQIGELQKAAYFWYCRVFGCLKHEMPVSKAVEKILDYLKLEFECEPAKEEDCLLKPIFIRKKPKKKAKKKAKKKK